MLLLLSFSAAAQQSAVSKSVDDKAISMPKSEQLQHYTKVVIDGDFNIVFKRAEEGEGEKALYDQRSGNTSRFRIGVDKHGVLTLSRRGDVEQDGDTTDVVLWYEHLEALTVSEATVVFEGVVESKLFDMEVRSGATVAIKLDVLDAEVVCTGKSAVSAEGRAKYLDLHISNATFEGLELQSVACSVDASHEAVVKTAISERLEAITSTSAKMLYKGEPTIIRGKNSLFGGVIERVKQ